jgi:hypothetical protein
VPKNGEKCGRGSSVACLELIEKRPIPKFTVKMESIDLQVKKRLMGFEPTTFCMATTLAVCGFRHRNRHLQALFESSGRHSVRRYGRIRTDMQRFGNSWPEVPETVGRGSSNQSVARTSSPFGTGTQLKLPTRWAAKTREIIVLQSRLGHARTVSPCRLRNALLDFDYPAHFGANN